MFLFAQTVPGLHSSQFIVSQSLYGRCPVAHVIVGDSLGFVLDTTVGSLGAWLALSSYGASILCEVDLYWRQSKNNSALEGWPNWYDKKTKD